MSKPRGGKIGAIVPHPTMPDVLMVPLTNGGFSLIDEDDECRVDQDPWFAFTTTNKRGGSTTYVMSTRRRVFMHRLLFGLTSDDRRVFVDHKNHDTFDNRRENLRLATRRQNSHNRLKNPRLSSDYMGVSWHKPTNNWTSNISVSIGGRSRKIALGLFESEVEAAVAYRAVAVLLKDPEFFHAEPIPDDMLPSEDRTRELEAGAIQRVKSALAGQKTRVGASSRFRGVMFDKDNKCWRAVARVNGKRMKLGNYPAEAEAAFVYELVLPHMERPRPLEGQPDPKLSITPERQGEIRAFVKERIETLLSGKTAKVKAASGYHGVVSRSGKWWVRVRRDGLQMDLGLYDHSIEAAFAYDLGVPDDGPKRPRNGIVADMLPDPARAEIIRAEVARLVEAHRKQA